MNGHKIVTDKGGVMAQQQITELYAFVSIDPDRQAEAIIGMRDTPGGWQALIGDDYMKVQALKPIAKRIAHDTGREVRLIKFTTREELPL